MAITKGKKSESLGAVRDFIAVYDVLKYRPTGVEELVAGKGTRVPFAKAIRLGLLNSDGSTAEVHPDGKIGTTAMFYMGYVPPVEAKKKVAAPVKDEKDEDEKDEDEKDEDPKKDHDKKK